MNKEIDFNNFDYSFENVKSVYEKYVRTADKGIFGKVAVAAKDIVSKNIWTIDAPRRQVVDFVKNYFMSVKKSGISLPSPSGNENDKTNDEFIYENYAFNDGAKMEYGKLMDAIKSETALVDNDHYSFDVLNAIRKYKIPRNDMPKYKYPLNVDYLLDPGNEQRTKATLTGAVRYMEKQKEKQVNFDRGI
jgi:hypothetical protein